MTAIFLYFIFPELGQFVPLVYHKELEYHIFIFSKLINIILGFILLPQFKFLLL